jgi:lipid A disaccharide synthetase
MDEYIYQLAENIKSCGKDKEWVEMTGNIIDSDEHNIQYLQQVKMIYKSILDIHYITQDYWLYRDDGKNVYKASLYNCTYNIVV